MKSSVDKKMNKKVKEFNKELKKDVFNGRFWVRQYQKARIDGSYYYLYELKDREDPSRDRVIWKWILGNSIFSMNDIWWEMNDFIITSDFWEKYNKARFN